ncbi:uncharacterized protein LOC125533180 [Triticum urartu]|uniref:uncharacterized protein LOC125533180 n=1 Tax=Triticum urartu TaxID=4572 RepID=UPI0020435DCF|nr:uncharacterized protein LOC125533180 [Triticum urartu]
MAKDSRVLVLSRSTVKASVTLAAAPRVVAVFNLDLLPKSIPNSLFCVYRRPNAGGGLRDVVAAFEASLPSLLDHFLPLTGRIVADPRSGRQELLHCDNQGAELVGGEVGVALASLNYGNLGASLAGIGVPVQYDAAVALSVQLVSFACGEFAVAWASNHMLLDVGAASPRSAFFFFLIVSHTSTFSFMISIKHTSWKKLLKNTHTHAWSKEEGGNSFARDTFLLVSRDYIFFSALTASFYSLLQRKESRLKLTLDGYSLCMLANAWSELARSGAVSAAPNQDRSVFRPRAPPSYSPSLGEAFTAMNKEHLVNALTTESSFVQHTYYVEARDLEKLRAQASRSRADGEATRLVALSAYLWKALVAVVGSSDKRCRMGWWVDGRRRLTALCIWPPLPLLLRRWPPLHLHWPVRLNKKNSTTRLVSKYVTQLKQAAGGLRIADDVVTSRLALAHRVC